MIKESGPPVYYLTFRGRTIKRIIPRATIIAATMVLGTQSEFPPVSGRVCKEGEDSFEISRVGGFCAEFDGDGTEVGVDVGDVVGSGEGDELGVTVGVDVDVAEGEGLGDAVGVVDSLGVGDGVFGVGLEVGVTVAVGVGVTVELGVGHGSHPFPMGLCPPSPKCSL